MNIIYVYEDKFEKEKEKYDNCLTYLYYLEYLFDYKYKVISDCIEELQNNLEIKKLKRLEKI